MIDLPNNDMSAMFESDIAKAEKEAGNNEEKLKVLSDLITEVKDLDWEIECIQDELKDAERKKSNLIKNEIPDLFDELGLEKLETADGHKVEIKQFFAPTIKKANKEKAYSWLRENGYGAIIKNTVQAYINTEDKKSKERLIQLLDKLAYTYEEKESIHASTLKSFVNEQKEKGVDFPENTIDLFAVKEAKITKLKKRKGGK